MNKSENISDLAPALVEAQSDIKAAKQTGMNPHFRSAYSTLDDIWDAVRGALRSHQLAVIQHPVDGAAGVLCLETMILHKSGQWIAETLTMPLPKSDPQGYGSALTYARRYALAAMLGVSTSEDDDGNAATPPPKAKQNGEPPADLINPATLKALHAAGSSVYGKEWDERRAVLVEKVSKGRASSSKQLTMSEAKTLIDGINAKADGEAG